MVQINNSFHFSCPLGDNDRICLSAAVFNVLQTQRAVRRLTRVMSSLETSSRRSRDCMEPSLCTHASHCTASSSSHSSATTSSCPPSTASAKVVHDYCIFFLPTLSIHEVNSRTEMITCLRNIRFTQRQQILELIII